MNFYNENDPFAVAWLRELIAAGEIPAGTVDERSIRDVRGNNLHGYTQHHFFAGIAGWPLALKLAGWPPDRPVWTGSCPCQPFSAAGQRRGTSDERHLWPEFLRLIAERRPAVVLGEQVASADGRLWLAGVRADLEALGYAVGGADLCAAGVGAPHIRQRLFWVGFAGHHDRPARSARGLDEPEAPVGKGFRGHIPNGWQGQDPVQTGRAAAAGDQPDARAEAGGFRADGGMADAAEMGRRARPGTERRPESRPALAHDRSADGWANSEWLPCLDRKERRFEPGIFPLAHGVSARVGRLRGYGNAIVPQVAAEFIRAFLDDNDI